jgi:O-antigen/teichoic acid export membrane protein
MASLVERVFKGGAWVGALRVLQKSVGFGRKIILARLLFPEDFGLFGIAILLLEGFRVLTRTGFKDALIHVRERVDEYLHTSYWIQVAQGLITGILVYVGAPLVAQFFSEPRVNPVVRVLAIARVIYGFRSIGVVMLRRELDFRTDSLYRLSGTLSYFVVTVVLAVLWRDVWALVWGKVVSRSIMVVVSYLVHPYRPRLLFHKKRAVEIFRYGVWLLGTGIVSYISLQADNIVAGKIVGTGALGVYQMAYVVSSLPTTEVAKQIGRVVQSGFAEVQADPERLERMFRKVVLSIFSITAPLAVGMALTAPTLVPVVLGDKWSELIPILPILAFGGVARALGTALGSLFKATGDTNLSFRMESVRAIALGVGLFICIATSGGLQIIAYAFLFSVVIKTSVAFYYSFNRYSVDESLFYGAVPTIASSALMVFAVYITKNINTFESGIVSLSIITIVGSSVYLISHVCIESSFKFKILRYTYVKFKMQILNKVK